MIDNIIQAENVSRHFGDCVAVRGLDLRVPAGSVYGFLGRNGAGKTTAIKMLAGLLSPSSGNILVNGKNPMDFTAEDRLDVGYLSEKLTLPPGMKAGALIRFCAPFYPNWDFELEQRILKQFKIDPEKRISKLSLGMNRQLGLLLAVAPRPKLLLLDEPAGGLDVVARREFLDQMLELIREEGRTVFFSSHILSDVERVASDVGILCNGTLKVGESLDRLKETVKQVRFYDFKSGSDEFSVQGAFNQRKRGGECLVTLRITDWEQLDSLSVAHDCRHEVLDLNLEDLFIELVREDGEQAL